MNTKPKTPDKYVDADMTRLRSQAKAERKYQSNFDSVRLRVPVGLREQIKAYVATEHTTVNQWLVDLILAALPPKYHLPDEKKDDKITKECN